MTRIGRVESHVEREGTVSIEPREVLTSLPCEVERVAQAVRAHWGVEHSLHGVLDVRVGEAACRLRHDPGAQQMAVLRPMALHLLRREATPKRGIQARRKRAGWDRDDRLQVLTG